MTLWSPSGVHRAQIVALRDERAVLEGLLQLVQSPNSDRGPHRPRSFPLSEQRCVLGKLKRGYPDAGRVGELLRQGGSPKDVLAIAMC